MLYWILGWFASLVASFAAGALYGRRVASVVTIDALAAKKKVLAELEDAKSAAMMELHAKTEAFKGEVQKIIDRL